MANLETADKAYELFKKCIAIVPEGNPDSEDPIERSEGRTHSWAEKVITGFETARKQAVGDERVARLADGIVKETSQIIFVLFRRGLITKELEAEFRELPLFEQTDYDVSQFVNKRDEEIKRIVAERDKVQSEQRGLDIFQAILTQGMTEEEAERKMKAYEEKQKAALGE